MKLESRLNGCACLGESPGGALHVPPRKTAIMRYGASEQDDKPYTVTYQPENSCIMVVVQGVLDLPTFHNLVFDVAELVECKGCKRLLIDLCNAFPSESNLEIYKMPDAVECVGIGRDCKQGLVVGEKVAEFYFLETVFINRGYQVRLFDDMNAAYDWLFA